MKKILMLLLGIFCIFVIPKVEAQEYKLTKIDQDGIYFTRKGGQIPDKVGKFAIYYLGDNLAYCIEPNKSIITEDYMSSDGFIDLPYSDEVKEKMELYGYYGREYPGHDNVRYSMAAQSLIWEIAANQTVTFTTKWNGEGDIIDVTKEKNEILSLVEKHRILPNLPDYLYVDLMHEEIIKDPKGALSNFEITDKDGNDSWIDGNELHVIPYRKGNSTIHLERKKYDDLNTLIFVGKNESDTQTLGRLRFSDLSKRDITIVTDGVHIYLHKVDEEGNPIKISGIKFKIKNLNTGEYLCDNASCEYQTDSNGLITTKGVDFGEYQIEEIENQITPGYYWNSTKKKITISKDSVNWQRDKHAYFDVNFVNNSVNGSLEIYKKGEWAVFDSNNVTYQDFNLSSVYFDLYDNNGKFIKTLVTDAGGYAKTDNLKVGKYYVVEKTIMDRFVPNIDKIYFEIKQTNQYDNNITYRLNVKNYLKKGKLEFNKIDFDTKETIPDTIIEIYNSKGLLFTKKTDENGQVIIDNLPIGEYYIKEKEANYYYQKTDEIISFEIKENNEIVKKTMTNKRIIGNIEIYKKGEDYKYMNNDIIYEKTELANTIFDLYDSSDQLIETLKTNDDGYVKYELPLGKYYLKERNGLSNYITNHDLYYFEIGKDDYKAVNALLTVDNYLKKGTLEFIKEDLNSGEGIPNTIIEIYSENGKLLFTKETGEDGKIIINNLPLGKYYLKEKEANSMYQITNEKVFFEIKEDGETVNAKLINEKKSIPVPKTGTKEEIIAHSIFGICMLFGLGGLYFERKKVY